MSTKVRDYAQLLRRRLIELLAPGSIQNNKAQELVEYALLAGFIAVTIAATVPYQVTAPLSTIFSKIQDNLVTKGGA
jgi:Flp pilus assembly pilin Flp